MMGSDHVGQGGPDRVKVAGSHDLPTRSDILENDKPECAPDIIKLCNMYNLEKTLKNKWIIAFHMAIINSISTDNKNMVFTIYPYGLGGAVEDAIQCDTHIELAKDILQSHKCDKLCCAIWSEYTGKTYGECAIELAI